MPYLKKNKLSQSSLINQPMKRAKIRKRFISIADITDKQAVLSCVDNVVEKNGLLNNCLFPAISWRGDDWSGEIETSLTATKNIIDYSKTKFVNTGNKSIVVVGSIANTLIAEEQPVSYHVAKAGLNQLVRFYATVIGPSGIRINSVSPGVIMKEEAIDFYKKNSQLLDLYRDIIPLKRMGNSEDVVNTRSFM